MAAVLLVVAVFTLFVIFLWRMENTREKKMLAKIPGPSGWPLVGAALSFTTDGAEMYARTLEFCKEFCAAHGVCKIWAGPQGIVMVNQPQTVEVLLNSSKHTVKGPQYRFLTPWLSTGLLISAGEKWKVRRKLITPTFHFKILADFVQVFNQQSQILIDKLDRLADTGSFDIYKTITLCSLDIICDTAMGKHVNAQSKSDSEYVKAIYKIGGLIQKRMIYPWLAPDFIFYKTQAGKDHNRCLETLHSFTKQVIQERSAELDKQMAEKTGKVTLEDLDSDKPLLIGKRKRLAFLDMLLFAAKCGADLNHADIQAEVDTFMVEGHDTISAAINWALHSIGANAEVQKQLHEEMDRIFGDDERPLTMDDLKELTYLERVIKECLRLFPPVPFIARTTTEDCTIGGFKIPKGISGMVVTASLHRDPKHFPDPDRFDPDRWLLDNCAKRHPFSYIPFSAGLRNCIGQRFAMKEIKVVLSYITRRYDILSTQSREDLRPVGTLVLRPQDGIHVKLTRRKK